MKDGEALIKSLRFQASQALQRHNASRIAVAVSGGGDSMACLDLMAGQAAKVEIPLQAVTVDHGLRAEAAEEIGLVATYCAAHNIPHEVLRWSWDGTGNLQAEARDARYRLIGDWARQAKVDRVFLGHTQTDVAETFLMRLARKSGVSGLAMMDTNFERHGVHWSRPFWQRSREDLRTYLTAVGVPWAEDASNDDDRFDRSKARKALDALAPLGINENALSAVSFNLMMAKAALDQYLRDTAKRHVEETNGDLILPCHLVGDYEQIPMETLYRLRAEALRWVGGGAYGPRSDGMIEMEIALHDAKTHTLGGCVITREDGKRIADRRWRITREHNAVKNLATPTTALWDGRWLLDGDHDKSLEIRALGEAIKDTPWRETGLPRTSLLASPAVWQGNMLISAPLAGLPNGWTANATGRGKFTDFLLFR